MAHEQEQNHKSVESTVAEYPMGESQVVVEEKARKLSIQKERLDALGLSLAKSRSAAIEGRQQSGIEMEWQEDEEHYEGVDDTNRGEMAAWRTKPAGQADLRANEATSSTVFINITRPYTDSASSRVGDMLLPTDDRAWSIDPTPIPSMLEMSKGNIPNDIQKQITQQNPGNPEQAQQVQQGVVEAAVDMVDQAKASAEKATKRIDDWHVECQYHAQMRLVIDDCCKLGSGLLKGPSPSKTQKAVFENGELVLKSEIAPSSKRIDPWNFYPDPGCGENLHNGGFTWERDDITAKQLLKLKGLEGYLDEQIDLCVREGAYKAVKEVDSRTDVHGIIRRDKTNLFEIWYYYGPIEQEDFEAMGKEAKEGKRINGQITMVNNHVIRGSMNPLDTGEFPYDLMPWQRRVGMPWGMGVARQVRTPQRVVNGGARNMMDNAGRAGGPQLVVQQGVVIPENGIYEVTPWKIWLAGEDALLDHLDNAFRFVQIPMMQVELEAIINLGLRLAEDVTGLSMIMQGQQSSRNPDTLGGMELLNNNANSVLRRIARIYDDMVTTPHIRRYYDYLLQYGPEEDEKSGDFSIDARGSSALIERYAQSEEMMKLTEFVLNPMYGIDPKKWFVEILKSRRLDPVRFEYDDEEWKKIVEQLQQPQQDPRAEIEMAKIEWAKEKLNMEHQQKGEEMGLDLKNALALSQEDSKEDGEKMHLQQRHDQAMAKLNADLDVMREQGKQDISLQDIKAMLAKTVMTLNAQKEMAGMKSGAQSTPEVATPLAEPGGRAENGKAFQQ